MTKKEKQVKTCIYCKSQYQAARSNQSYCSTRCKEDARLEKKRIATAKRKANNLLKRERLFDGSAFALYLVAEVKRGKTVQILSEHTSATFLELYKLSKLRTSYSGFKDGKPQRFYELSHIQPVSQPNFVGLLHPRNLVIATQSFNRSRGTAPPNLQESGKKIPRIDLIPKWSVSAKDTKAKILKKIKTFLGASILKDFYKEARISLTRKNSLQKKLTKLGIAIPEDMSLEQLDEIYKSATGKTVISTYERYHAPLALVLQQEIVRLNINGGQYGNLLEEVLEDSLKFYSSIKKFTEAQEQFIYRQVQRLLHGDKVQAFDLEVLVKYLPQTVPSFDSRDGQQGSVKHR